MKKLKIVLLAALCGAVVMSCEKEDATQVENENKTMNQVSTGTGGSMAQFTIIGSYLYTVDYKSLKVFLISDPANPELLETINLGVGIETIYPENDHLFIGTQNGVLIYDVTNPRSPEKVSEVDHVTSCDPVIANDHYAIATLRGGTPCNGNLNVLDIIDIEDLSNPILVASRELINPYGLGFANTNENIVYVCDGYAGLKAYDISNLEMIEEVMFMEELHALDVIAREDNSLVVLTRQGIYQFDASNPTSLIQKSFIGIQ